METTKTSAEAKIKELGIELMPLKPTVGLYAPVVIIGNLAYTSGQVPWMLDGSLLNGKVGQEKDLAGGQAAARQCGIVMLSALKHFLGSLDKIKRVVKVLGFVNSTPDFTQQPAVVNGFSELFRDVFGEERGVAARSAVSAPALPMNATVEVEAIFELYDNHSNL